MARLPLYNFRLSKPGRAYLKTATLAAKYGFTIPGPITRYLMSFAWQLSVDGGPYHAIRIDPKTGAVRP